MGYYKSMIESGTYNFAEFVLGSNNRKNVTKHEYSILSRVVDLYKMLYIQKYSNINPRFTPYFILSNVLNGLCH